MVKKTLSLALPVLLCFAVGWLSSLMQREALVEWYPTLNLSPLNPPPIVFPIAWGIIYLLMGISLGVLLMRGDMSVVRLWLVQLLVNFLWSVMFFALRSPLAGLITLLMLDVLVFTYIIYAAARSSIAAWLFAPYFIWLLFATYLNGYVYRFNSSSVEVSRATAATTDKFTPNKSQVAMNYSIPQLRYADDVLMPAMSSETIEYHYGKHFQTYVDNLNRLVVGTPYEGMNVENIVLRAEEGPLFNNAAQVYNHALFFDELTPSQTPMPVRLEQRIIRDFGSVESFWERFSMAAASLFGSGWTWLVEDRDGELSIISTSNADTPLRYGYSPLLTIDVWEHAYYIDYRNRRAEFIKNFRNIIDWERVDNRLKKDVV